MATTDSSKNDPIYYEGFAAQCVRQEELGNFTPQSVRQLRSFEEHRTTVVDVACKESASSCYYGTEKERESVELKFGDFVDYYQASFKKQQHWLQTVDGMEFYLCQCPIAVYKPDSTCRKAALPGIMDNFCLPPLLQDQPMTQVNFWMTVKPGRTTLHYDAYRNVLVVLYGKKTVTLYPPSESAKMYPYPVHTKSANHSQVNIIQPDLVKHSDFREAPAQRFAVTAGDALFIPEGWWHQVDSDEFTIAINYWWSGEREQLVADPRMTPYYARVLVEELIKQQCETRLSKLRASSTTAQSTEQGENPSTIATFFAASGQSNREKELLSLSDASFVDTQRRIATTDPIAWRELLKNASVDCVAVLTQSWEDNSIDADFLGVLFSALGDEEGAIKQQLVAKQEQFRRFCAEEVFRSFG